MNSENFERRKSELHIMIEKALQVESLSDLRVSSLKSLESILSQYSYENRLFYKGILTHTIIDSLELDSKISEAFIQFDGWIN